ncbi:hypothetical protein HS088_TW09G00218 [Tripterygium wilfordii]|uniref:Uncharacterized protein n=1 Tax=Tripterygium wilfordii TaxID=458696 RepID=A0A7J7D7Z4_TRIWF|nr:hypothetical protein HS088_TW09G00218 [Tripterygium wilfordii]
MVVAQFVYILNLKSDKCKQTWTGLSSRAFSGLCEFVKLSLSSALVLCLENGEIEMSNCSEQMIQKTESHEGQKKESVLEGLPMESSPYLKDTNLEDYKRNAYGTEGHLPVNPNQGGGGTDAPTVSGSDLSDGKAAAVDTANRHGIP